MWKTVLDKMLGKLIVTGRLNVAWPDGTRDEYGPGDGLEAEVRLTQDSIVRELGQKPVLALGEGYMDGRIDVPPDRLYDFLALLIRNQQAGEMPRWFDAVQALRGWTRGIEQRNNPLRSQKNVQHHYDISEDLYRLFLDEDMQYSCAYFTRPDMTLEEAQQAKKDHIARKLRIEPGMSVLDIGCGWGGMALTLARDHGARVTGVTLSENQLATAQARARESGLEDRVEFQLRDYRNVDRHFDRIVSVGMLEHVGAPQFDTYFEKVDDILAPEGIALIHTIGHVSQPQATSKWLDKYIFPGGYIPSLSEVSASIEKTGLWAADVEVLRGHYAPTLNHWRRRFEAALPQVRRMYDETFVRMWRFYLAACEASFEETFQGVFHLQLSHQQYAVPVTRDYLYRTDSSARMLHAAQ
ncbi:cyclopropane-fatty-acyl-phospholipid synthase [Salipiger aestuarii]|uniref:Cyclopropane-fatty-acyl-phospholipid synthase n=1 Tax=Salipiger aestuarii TaxID=568098 RepID=A0A327XUP3_9RHOB|nr:cyclopropane-fatty-acyl-phospholipid synthase family protein [Salipiger aestuarii]EIE52512.1 cyclopropane-fatty-acyl-phospholipid synthase [Citreicella sp. 357]KAA8606165.1 cyclopropane-fatty-acyl-phospholipid synthase [Salipiger aestuarii]KAA8614125.1 cyclopropane-fatty-acyl-phospholipid synthase [Salipiger aestuarii]KAB2540836.1 cyclopropane-fatty-acyl-phospholipid synthase [Salipiger aestuarii]RAK12383.1 cyclopropane-fatty-acyl-phospholipid synthase [Salipiger aestuarii]